MPTEIQSVPDAVLASEFPSLADRAANTYNTKAKAWADSENAMVTRTREIALTAHNNATVATEQAVIATTKAGEASSSAQAAADSKTAAQGYADNLAALDDLWLGAATSDPTTGKGGAPLVAGNAYVNSVTGYLRAYNGSAWVQGISAVAGVSSVNGLTGPLTGFVTEGGAQTLTNKTLVDLILTLGGSQGAIGQVPVSRGAGLPPEWADPPGAGDHYVTVNTGNGHGSTNNKIRRFTTIEASGGTGVVYADSATLGATFTIALAGLYVMTYTEGNGVAQPEFGVSVNSDQLTTSIIVITATHRKALASPPSASWGTVTCIERLAVNDVVRAHTDGTVNGAGVRDCRFSIRRVGA